MVWPTHFSLTCFNAKAILLIAPVALILVAENLGHFKAVSAMAERNLSPYMGRAFCRWYLYKFISFCWWYRDDDLC